jgi:hypothetical protein
MPERISQNPEDAIRVQKADSKNPEREVKADARFELVFENRSGIMGTTVTSGDKNYMIRPNFKAKPGVNYRVIISQQTKKRSGVFEATFNCVSESENSVSEDEKIYNLVIAQRSRLENQQNAK